ncbi:MAG: DUF5357 family protein, partial [Phormidium sp.]
FGWFGFKNPLIVHGFSLSTWIFVELICLFAATLWLDFASFILIIWPALSAIIAAWPEFIAANKNLKNLSNEKRLKLLIWILFHLVISCWLNFSLIIQYWVSEYPSLLADDLSQSDFVVKIQPFSPPVTEGEKILKTMERQLKTQIDGKIWVVAESWLKDTNQREELLSEAKKQISGLAENDLWKLRIEVAAQKTGYNLSMIAEWQGPSSNPQGYLLKKVCQVRAGLSRYSVGVVRSMEKPTLTQQPTPSNTKVRRVRTNNNARVAKTVGTGLIRPSLYPINSLNKPTLATAKPVKVANVQCQSVTKQIIGRNQLKTSPKL